MSSRNAPSLDRHLGRYRTYGLPHIDIAEALQFITFRLFDSAPVDLIRAWTAELAASGIVDPARQHRIVRRRVYLREDEGHGVAWLKNPAIADVVQGSLLHGDGERYSLHAWCVMPNHVHVLARMFRGHPLDKVVQAWKSYTAHEANRILGRTGWFWQSDYYDRLIRNEIHYQRVVRYIENNPVKAGLVRASEDWPWSSAGFGGA